MKEFYGDQAAHFVQPIRQLAVMLIAVALVVAGTFISRSVWIPVFDANPYLNGVIVGVFGVGLLACFWQVEQIMTSVLWIRRFIAGHERADVEHAPRLLAPLAGLLRTRSARIQLSTTSARSILDSVASRMDESRDIARYLSNLLIFLGLLGTFFGLATTVPALVKAMQSLAPAAGGDGADVFQQLIAGLETQLDGMGTAFSSSLLGLAGSLVVSLLDLLAGHGQNGFYRQLEEWLSGITAVGLGQPDGDTDETGSEGSSAQALEVVAEQLWMLRTAIEQMNAVNERRDEGIQDLASAFREVAQSIETMSETVRWSGDQTRESRTSLESMAAGQEALQEHFRQLALNADKRDTHAQLKLIESQLSDALRATRDFRDDVHRQVGEISTILKQATTSSSDDDRQD